MLYEHSQKSADSLRNIMFYFWVIVLGFTIGGSSVFTSAAPPEECEGKYDLVFLLDSSESVRDSAPSDQPLYNYELLKDFSRRVVQSLTSATDDVRVAMLQFASETHLTFHLNRYVTSIQVQDGITKMEHQGGNTNTADALKFLHEDMFRRSKGMREDSKKVAVILTDGLSNIKKERTISEAQEAMGKDIEIFSVAVTKFINKEELFNISSQPTERHFLHVLEFEQLRSIVDVLVHRICGLPDPPTTSPPSENCIDGCLRCPDENTCEECMTGWFKTGTTCTECIAHCDVCRNTQTCDICQIGWYWDPTANKCEECELIADLALIIDVSGSIRDKNPKDESYDNYQILKDFIKSLVRRLDVRANKIRLGAVRFSNSAWLMFHLDAHSNPGQIEDAIDDMKYGGGETNTSGAIRIMRKDVFNPMKGDRQDVPNVALVITDGESNRDQHLTMPEAEMAKEEHVTFFVVGITNDINEDEVKGIATDPDSEHYFNSPDIKNLDSLLFQILKEVCNPQNTAVSGQNGNR